VIASVRFDDGNLKVFQHLLRLGILDMIAPSEGDSAEESSLETNSPPKTRRVTRQTSVVGTISMLARSASNIGSVEVQIPEKLGEIYFLDVNIVGWAIRLQNLKALQYFMKKNFNITASIDARGNPCLHYIAMYGSPDMVDVLIGDKRLRWELENARGETAGMLAAKHGNQKVAKKLFACKASARRSLDGKYAAWVLAFARKSERFEKNLQTGRVGNDDELYFDVSPDPYYVMWYP
jgi:predicted RNA-binding protein associated with RNAse of E/G family